MLRLCDLRHCVYRRQERHSISAATPSSISTMTPSPIIASLVGRFIKTLDGKTTRGWWPPAPSYAL